MAAVAEKLSGMSQSRRVHTVRRVSRRCGRFVRYVTQHCTSIPLRPVMHTTADRALVGISPQIVRLREYLDKVAVSDATVLITGETGTGKECVARYLAPAKSTRRQAAHLHQLLRAAGWSARERALRPRARRVHRRAPVTAPDGCGTRPAGRSSSTRSAK